MGERRISGERRGLETLADRAESVDDRFLCDWMSKWTRRLVSGIVFVTSNMTGRLLSCRRQGARHSSSVWGFAREFDDDPSSSSNRGPNPSAEF